MLALLNHSRNPQIVHRFWAHTRPHAECLLWQGAVNVAGYGRLYVHYHPNQLVLAHRFSYVLHTQAEIPEVTNVCHHCDVRLCVRFEHLFLGSQSQNMVDMYAKHREGQRPKGSAVHNAKLTEAQVITIRTRRAAGTTLRTLAEEYHVHLRTIQNITAKQIWKHLIPSQESQ